MHGYGPTNFALETLWRTASDAPLLTPESEAQLACEAQAGSQRAFDTLLRAHMRLVLAIARQFTTYGVSLEDLVSEGLLGLVEAARRFDPERGVRLSAYAAWWIRSYMRRYTIANRRIVRAPSTRKGRKLLARLRSTQRTLAQAAGEAPTAEAVASELGVDARDVEEMEAALSGRDVPYRGETDGAAAFELAAEGESPEQLVAEAEQRHVAGRAISNALATESARDRIIVERRHLGEESASLAALGRSLGLSRERVRQLNGEACKRLRAAVLPYVA